MRGSPLKDGGAAGLTGLKMLVKRPHIGGSAYDKLDEAGLLTHEYGPHIFHTNSLDIVENLSQFTDWRRYEHSVLAQVDGCWCRSINRATINALYGLDLQVDEQASKSLASRAELIEVIETSEDVVIAAVGRERKAFSRLHPQARGLNPSQLDNLVDAGGGLHEDVRADAR